MEYNNSWKSQVRGTHHKCRGKVDDFRKMCYVQAVIWSRRLSEGFDHMHGSWSAHWHSSGLVLGIDIKAKAYFRYCVRIMRQVDS